MGRLVFYGSSELVFSSKLYVRIRWYTKRRCTFCPVRDDTRDTSRSSEAGVVYLQVCRVSHSQVPVQLHPVLTGLLRASVSVRHTSATARALAAWNELIYGPGTAPPDGAVPFSLRNVETSGFGRVRSLARVNDEGGRG